MLKLARVLKVSLCNSLQRDRVVKNGYTNEQGYYEAVIAERRLLGTASELRRIVGSIRSERSGDC